MNQLADFSTFYNQVKVYQCPLLRTEKNYMYKPITINLF